MRTSRHLITALAIVVALASAMPGTAAAKGGVSYVVGATLSGGHLPHAVNTRISIPENGYEMRTLHSPANGLFAGPFELFRLHQTPMPYELVLHYDYARYGGKQDKAALYDGDRLIYFPRAGTWHEASPRLAKALRTEILWGLAPADAQGIRGTAIDAYTREILLALAVLVLLGAAHRVWRGNGEVASPLEVNARLRARASHRIDDYHAAI